jgi:hypothetical protein
MRDGFGMQRFGTGSSYHGTPMIWPFERLGIGRSVVSLSYLRISSPIHIQQAQDVR